MKHETKCSSSPELPSSFRCRWQLNEDKCVFEFLVVLQIATATAAAAANQSAEKGNIVSQPASDEGRDNTGTCARTHTPVIATFSEECVCVCEY